MASVDLSHCIARLEWANEARDALNREVRRWFLDHDPYDATVEYHAEADIHTFRLTGESPPQRLGVLIGNTVHQIRASLDNLVWQLVIANGQTPRGGARGNQFPIYTRDDPNRSFSDRTANCLRGVHPDHRALIEGLQPYKRPSNRDPATQHPLGVLAHLSNRDKHQVLQVTVAELSRSSRWVVDFTGGFEKRMDGHFFAEQWPKAGAIVAWAKFFPPGFHANVHMHTVVSMQLATVDPPNPQGRELTLLIEPELRFILANVRAVVDSFRAIETGDEAKPVSFEIEALKARYEAHKQSFPSQPMPRGYPR